MAKKMGYTFLLFLLLILVLSLGPSEASAYKLISLDFYGGPSYNTYNLEVFEDWVSKFYEADETFRGGWGFFVGTRQWVELWGVEYLALGGEVESISVSYSDIDISLSNLGVLLTLTLRLSEILGDFPGEIFLIGAGGISLANLVDGEVDIGKIEENYLGPSFKGVLEALLPLTQQISVGGRAGYRFSRPHSEGDIDFSGFEASLSLKVSF